MRDRDEAGRYPTAPAAGDARERVADESFAAAPEARNPVMIGQPATSRRQAASKTLWIGIWLFYLVGPVVTLASGGWGPHTAHRYSVAATVGGAVGLTLFIGAYVLLVFRRMVSNRLADPVSHCAVGTMAVLCLVLGTTLGPDWLVLFIFTSVATSVALPWRLASRTIPATTAALVLVGLLRYPGEGYGYLLAYVLPALGSGYAMVGVQYLIRTTRELRAAREEVARLAAGEERLRLARDLHDLLGHSLSLITLKSELAGRMLPDRIEDAARQVADIEQVSRQALVDVREAVTGYRRPRLPVELAGARAALRAAGITAHVDPALERAHRPHPGDPGGDGGLTAEGESALAWALREAVTNVVRHSGARRCELLLTEEWEADERRYLCLSVIDDGQGPPRGHPDGNGLSGLRERLALADGTLETGPAPRSRGFALRALVPRGPAAATRPEA